MTFYKTLVEIIDETPGVTWPALTDRFGGRNRETLRSALVRHHRNDLVTLVDRNSGYEKKTPYGDTLVRVLEENDGLTWGALSTMFEGRSENALRAALYYAGRPELVRRVKK